MSRTIVCLIALGLLQGQAFAQQAGDKKVQATGTPRPMPKQASGGALSATPLPAKAQPPAKPPAARPPGPDPKASGAKQGR